VLMSGSGDTQYSPFAVVNGQVFISDAFVQDGTITNAKIGNFIQSNNYSSSGTGWNLDKNTGFTFKSATAGQGSITLDGRGLRVYDSAGNWKVKVGDLS